MRYDYRQCMFAQVETLIMASHEAEANGRGVRSRQQLLRCRRDFGRQVSTTAKLETAIDQSLNALQKDVQ